MKRVSHCCFVHCYPGGNCAPSGEFQDERNSAELKKKFV